VAGVLFVVGQDFPEHWKAALESGFWETVRRVEVHEGDALVFWQAGQRKLLGVGTATQEPEPVDYEIQTRPWSTSDPTEYQFRYRFEPVQVSRSSSPTWPELMVLLGQKPRRGANTAPFRFDRNPDELVMDIERSGPGPDGTFEVEVTDAIGRSRPGSGRPLIGDVYIDADEEIATKDGVPFQRDPQAVDRGLRGHARTQNALAAWLRGQGITPRPAGKVNFDLAWEVGGEVYVAEIKSLHRVTERNQLRLGLGEVIDFSFRLGGARRVLAVEREPTDDAWMAICESVDVRLAWPGAFDRLLPMA